MSRSFQVKKRTSKDSGDGMFTLIWDCNPEDLPEEFRKAPVKSPFCVSVTTEPTPSQPSSETHHFSGIRLPMSDRGDGQVSIRLATVGGAVPDCIVFAKNGMPMALEITPADDISASNLPLTPEERSKTFRTIMVLISDAGFIRWLATQDDAHLIDRIESLKPQFVENAVIEVVLRKIHAHSRSDILHNALICERAERLIRAYRETTWKSRA